jgi:hypothetical protein
MVAGGAQRGKHASATEEKKGVNSVNSQQTAQRLPTVFGAPKLLRLAAKLLIYCGLTESTAKKKSAGMDSCAPAQN